MIKRIVIDARLIGTSTGVYIENLLNHLQNIDTTNEYVVLEPKEGSWKPKATNFRTITAPIRIYTFAEQFRLALILFSLKPDLVHFCMPQQPLLYIKGKRVTTVHDTTLVRYDNIDMNPLIYKTRKFIFSRLLKNVARRSQAIVIPTQYVKNDLLAYTSEQYRDKFFVTPEAGEPLAPAPEPIKVLLGKKFFFFVGNAFPYKNIPRIIDAYAQLKKKYPDMHLALAGKKDFFYEEIEKYVQEQNIPDVHILGFVSEGEKRWMFQNAQCYVVASLSEGFHIPGLEAMYEGCAVVSSNATCLPEVYKDAAYYFDPLSVDDMVVKIDTVLGDDTLRQDLIAKGYSQVKKYSWRRMAEQTLAVYNKVLSEK